jgi:plastocyanin
MIASARAAPSISLPSFANYQLAASTTNIQECTSTNVTIAAFVCGQSSVQVTINGDGVCGNSTNTDARCFFSPATVTITAGMSVTWHDTGSLFHLIVSNSTLNVGLPFFSGYVYQNNYFTQQFFTTGTYHYYDSYRNWMKGTVIVTQAVAPPPVVTSFGASGSIGWNVAGLDQKDALLGVSHRINVYNQTAAPQALVYNDSGILEQSIDLGTRQESPATIGLLQALPFGLSFSGFYNGYGYGFGGFGNPIGYYPGPFYNFQPVHTLWWVNGPLDNGSIVELLTGYASVTGSKSIQLGSPLGLQDAWSVTSVYSQSSNQTQPGSSNNFYYCPYGFPYFGGPQPQPQCYISEASLSVLLKADYGQHSDLLVGFSSTISTLTQFTTTYAAGSTVYGSFNGYGSAITVSAPVSIVHTSSAKLTFTLGISTTNIDLSKRMVLSPAQTTSSTSPGGNGANSPSPTINQPTTTTMGYFFAGAGTAVLISGALWAILRNRRKPVLSTSPPVTTP